MPGLLAARAAEAPDAVAVIGRAGGSSMAQLTRGQLRDEAAAVACGLAARGVRSGDRVAWILDNRNGADALVIYHAVLTVGAVNVPINPRLTPREVAQIVEHSGARALVVGEHSEDRATAVDRASCDVVMAPAQDALAALRASSRGFDVTQSSDTDIANILYTSGTTGRPKGVVLSHGASLAAAIAWSDALRLQGDDVLQSPFPIFSGAGLHFNALSCLFAGCSVVVDDYDTASSLALVNEMGATVYVAVPSIYSFWVEHLAQHPVDLQTLRIIDYGGSAMPPALIERLRDAVPTAGLVQSYGLTEAGPGGTYLAEEYARSRLGSIGNRCAGRFTQVRIMKDDGADARAGELGELLLRGPSVMEGYHDDPAATEAAFVDGWLRSGDVVRSDAEGFLFHVDRTKDIIVRGGFNVASVEVEAALVSHPAVVEAAVFAVPHPRLGEDVHAAIVLRGGSSVDESELLEHCVALLADFKRPRHVTIVGDLPRNSAGKVLKRRLRDDFSARRDPAS